MNRQKGMTLIEVAMATAILGVMMLAAFGFMSHMMESVAMETQVTEVEVKGNIALNTMANSLRSAYLPQGWNPTVWQSGDDAVVFLIPVDYDSDGDVFDTSMEPEWGAIHTMDGKHYLDVSHITSSSGQNFRTTYKYVANAALEFNESVRGVDLNRDGDLTDIFDVGHIEISHPAATSSSPSKTFAAFSKEITADIIIRKKGQSVADIDDKTGDSDPMGTNDPMFWQDGSTMYITLFVADVDEEEPVLVKLNTAVELRNFE